MIKYLRNVFGFWMFFKIILMATNIIFFNSFLSPHLSQMKKKNLLKNNNILAGKNKKLINIKNTKILAVLVTLTFPFLLFIKKKKSKKPVLKKKYHDPIKLNKTEDNIYNLLKLADSIKKDNKMNKETKEKMLHKIEKRIKKNIISQINKADNAKQYDEIEQICLLMKESFEDLSKHITKKLQKSKNSFFAKKKVVTVQTQEAVQGAIEEFSIVNLEEQIKKFKSFDEIMDFLDNKEENLKKIKKEKTEKVDDLLKNKCKEIIQYNINSVLLNQKEKIDKIEQCIKQASEVGILSSEEIKELDDQLRKKIEMLDQSISGKKIIKESDPSEETIIIANDIPTQQLDVKEEKNESSEDKSITNEQVIVIKHIKEDETIVGEEDETIVDEEGKSIVGKEDKLTAIEEDKLVIDEERNELQNSTKIDNMVNKEINEFYNKNKEIIIYLDDETNIEKSNDLIINLLNFLKNIKEIISKDQDSIKSSPNIVYLKNLLFNKTINCNSNNNKENNLNNQISLIDFLINNHDLLILKNYDQQEKEDRIKNYYFNNFDKITDDANQFLKFLTKENENTTKELFAILQSVKVFVKKIVNCAQVEKKTYVDKEIQKIYNKKNILIQQLIQDNEIISKIMRENGKTLDSYLRQSLEPRSKKDEYLKEEDKSQSKENNLKRGFLKRIYKLFEKVWESNDEISKENADLNQKAKELNINFLPIDRFLYIYFFFKYLSLKKEEITFEKEENWKNDKKLLDKWENKFLFIRKLYGEAKKKEERHFSSLYKNIGDLIKELTEIKKNLVLVMCQDQINKDYNETE